MNRRSAQRQTGFLISVMVNGYTTDMGFLLIIQYVYIHNHLTITIYTIYRVYLMRLHKYSVIIFFIYIL